MKKRRVRTKQALLLCLCLMSVVFGTGCQQIIALISMLVGGGGGGVFNPPGSGGGGGIIPPGLTGGGGPLSPTSALPPPKESQGTIQQIVQEYGVPVTGSGASLPVMQRVAASLRYFPKDHYQGLTGIDIPQSGGGSIAGLWQSWGRGAKITLYSKSYRRVPVTMHTTTHEIGHHASLFSRSRVLGEPFSNALGSGVNAFPSGYSYTNWKEKIAENLSFILLGNACESRPRPSWKPTAAAMQIIQQEFQRRSSGVQGTGTSGTGAGSGTGTGTGNTGNSGTAGPTASTPPRPGTTS